MSLSATYYVAIGCVLALYIFWFAALGVMRSQQFSKDDIDQQPYDNKEPWKSKETLKGKGLRAKAAMNNHAEQFQFFAAAVILNLVVRGPDGDSLAVAIAAGFHVLCRMVHLITYIEDSDWWRSTAFSLGFLTNLVLYGFAFAPSL